MKYGFNFSSSLRLDRCVMVCSRFHSPKLFLPPLLISILFLDILIGFHFVRSRVLRCLKHNLLSSPKINIFDSFLMIYYSKQMGRICSYFKTKKTFGLRKSYVPIYIFPYNYISIFEYIQIS